MAFRTNGPTRQQRPKPRVIWFSSSTVNTTITVDKADLQPTPQAITLNKTWSTVITAAALQPAPKAITFGLTCAVGKADLQPAPQDVILSKTWSLAVTKADLQPVPQTIALEKTWSLTIEKADISPVGQNVTLTWTHPLSLGVDPAALSVIGKDIGLSLTSSAVAVTQPSGGWIESASERRYARIQDEIRKELEEQERAELAEKLERVLVTEGSLTQEQADLIRLRGLAAQYNRDDLPNRARRALAFAERAQSDLSLRLAMREIRRVEEEEEMAVLLLMTLD